MVKLMLLPLLMCGAFYLIYALTIGKIPQYKIGWKVWVVVAAGAFLAIAWKVKFHFITL